MAEPIFSPSSLAAAAATAACVSALQLQQQQQQNGTEMSSIDSNSMVCRVCHGLGSDVRVVGCGCTWHARCVPLNLIISDQTAAPGTSSSASLASGGSNAAAKGAMRSPVAPNTLLCPTCKRAPVSGLYMLPLSTTDLDRAVEIRKTDAREKATAARGAAAAAADNNPATNGKRRGACAEDWFVESLCESSYLLLSHGSASNALSTDNDYQRTGRWTDDEIAYVDFLLDAFDHGKLPMEHGMKLNDFLAEMLLCKSSRLTKKLKNARLSIRSYQLFNRYNSSNGSLDVDLMSTLEAKFLQSITSQASTLELRFNMTRLWRSRLSNLCLQVGSDLLDTQDWIASLERMEKRAGQAEETIRKARRRRMGLALKTDSRTDQNGVFFAGVPVQRPAKRAAIAPTPTSNAPTPMGMVLSAPVPTTVTFEQQQHLPRIQSVTDASTTNSVTNCSEADSCSEPEFISDMLDRGNFHGNKNPKSANGLNNHLVQPPAGGGEADDYNVILNDLIRGCSADGTSTPPPYGCNANMRNNGGAFLEEIVNYLETHDLAFQHVDVWVPSYSGENKDIIRLYHAGHATRNDSDPALFCQLAEYGDYSSRFSFASSVGLPGRVFASEAPSWEHGLHEADPRLFERAGGAKVYGIKTGFGFPLATRVIGKIVVCLYSTLDLTEDREVVQSCMADLGNLCPEPKWKLVVEMGPSSAAEDNESTAGSSCVSSAGSATAPVAAPGIAQYKNGQESIGRATSIDHHKTAPPPEDASRAVSSAQEQLEHTMATLLGDHMPLQETTAGGEPTSSTAVSSNSMILPHFMSLRLMLLRSPTRRTAQENEILEVIKKSFQGYSNDGRRSERELAFLVVKDWQYLRGTTAPEPEPSKPQLQHHNHQRSASSASGSSEYKSHVMDPPRRPSSGSLASSSCMGPVAMPATLAFMDPRTIKSTSTTQQQTLEAQPKVPSKRKYSGEKSECSEGTGSL